MKTSIFFLAVFSCAVTCFFSCNKAGPDGKAIVTVFPTYNDYTFINLSNYRDTVYVKYNTKIMPVNPAKNYDAFFTGSVGEDHVSCKNLKPGNYFFFITGWDTTSNLRGSAGFAVTVPYKPRKNEVQQKYGLNE